LDNKSFRKDHRSRRRNNFNNSPREKSEENRVMHKCGICQQDIQDLSTAIALPEAAAPAHFDCVINKIKEGENLGKKEQVVYLGSGAFGIVENNSASQTPNFKIIKKISFEEHDDMPEWRKQLIKLKI